MPTLTAYITDGADDARELGGTPNLTQAANDCATSAAYLGFRFQGAGLPQGAPGGPDDQFLPVVGRHHDADERSVPRR